MSDYRLYFLDNTNHIRHAVELICASDRDAVRAAEERAKGHERLELWQRERIVKTWGADSSPAH
jgi:hypothetical protein